MFRNAFLQAQESPKTVETLVFVELNYILYLYSSSIINKLPVNIVQKILLVLLCSKTSSYLTMK